MSVPKIHGGSLVSVAGNIPFSRLHEDLLAIDQRGGFCYSMNSSAARIWELMPKPTPVNTICQRLTEEFGVEEEQCRADVMDFLGTLAEAGLVKVAD